MPFRGLYPEPISLMLRGTRALVTQVSRVLEKEGATDLDIFSPAMPEPTGIMTARKQNQRVC